MEDNNLDYLEKSPFQNPYFNLKSQLQELSENEEWDFLVTTANNFIELYPSAAYGYYMLGIAESRTGRHEESIKSFEKSIYLDTHPSKVFHRLGIAYFYLGDYDKALECYQKALKSGVNHHYLFHNMANAYFKKKMYEEALSFYQQALLICKDFMPSYYGLFRIYFELRNYDKALINLKQVIRENELPRYLYYYAKILLTNYPLTNHKRLSEAKSLLSTAIELDDDFALAYYERAYVNSILKDTIAYKRDKKAAFFRDPNLKIGHPEWIMADFY